MAPNMSKIHPQLFDALNVHTIAVTQAPLRVIVSSASRECVRWRRYPAWLLHIAPSRCSQQARSV